MPSFINSGQEESLGSEKRCLWIIYLLIVLLSSLIGDSIILIASIKYNAIKLNKFLVTVMQHIAVCDILASITYVLPTMMSLMADGWILGDFGAYVQVYLEAGSFTGSNILICILTTSKLLILKFPLSSGSWTSKNAHTICALAWVLSLIFPAVQLICDKNGLSFSFIEYNMNYGSQSDDSEEINITIFILYSLIVFIPVSLIVISTILTFAYLVKSRMVTKRTGGDKRWQGMVVVVTTATIYCVSVIPGSVTIFIDLPDITSNRVVESLVTLNIMCNFYIYSLTIPTFRCFIKSRALEISRRLVRCFRHCKQLQREDSTRSQRRDVSEHRQTIQTTNSL